MVGRLGDTVPSAMKGRWGISAQHVTVVAFMVATLLALAAWWVVQSRPQPIEALPITSAPSPAVTSVPMGDASPDLAEPSVAGTSAATSMSSADLVVHVAGKVRRPGIVTLPSGSRVIDALQAAGGPRPGVGLADLNLARPLTDGEQIRVGLRVVAPSGSVGSTPSASATGGLINVNTATSTELEELPGIGPVTAEAILQWRTEHGRFSTVEELLEVSGIGEVTLAKIRDHVTV
jgi:competence protein ComEA